MVHTLSSSSLVPQLNTFSSQTRLMVWMKAPEIDPSSSGAMNISTTTYIYIYIYIYIKTWFLCVCVGGGGGGGVKSNIWQETLEPVSEQDLMAGASGTSVSFK